LIKVTRLDDTEVLINPELIEMVESNPDTLITLSHGKKLIVKDSLEDILKKFLTYQQLIHKPLTQRVVKPISEYLDDE
jgi:flagellar protein FlbD